MNLMLSTVCVEWLLVIAIIIVNDGRQLSSLSTLPPSPQPLLRQIKIIAYGCVVLSDLVRRREENKNETPQWAFGLSGILYFM